MSDGAPHVRPGGWKCPFNKQSIFPDGPQGRSWQSNFSRSVKTASMRRINQHLFAMLVREHMKADPFSGAAYVFRAKRADRIKLIFWDGTSLCLLAKRLE
ncbi:IS66 family insertion sequence element accessory protein TnpB (plasmid) [Bradyrhizobium sp. PMVTL-01]|uniref:IS66 family insertion sequence element accessory protein TnpB n=1 Tax=Bradyrhizobium sp. PMVTL-01 TaxID=3434999 RepID=UPI003F703D13